MELRNYYQVLERRVWVVLVTAVITILVVATGVSQMTPVYSASTLVRVAGGLGGGVDFAELNYSDRLMSTYVQLLRSRPFLEEVIQRLELKGSFEELAASVKVETLANTELIKISAENTSPNQAMRIANTLASLLVEQKQKIYSGQASAQTILEQQLKPLEQRLSEDRALLAQLSQPTPQPGNSATILDLTTRIRFQEQTYAMLLSQYDKARVDEALRANSITIVETAVAPSSPSKPNIPLYIVLGAMVGLIAGVGLGFVFENLDPAIHSAEAVEGLAGIPLLGWIPAIKAPQNPRNGTVLSEGVGRAPADESFRILGMNTLSLASGAPPKTLLITSAEPQTGKSTVLANLAGAIARAGRRVVVVDADAGHPSLHRLFGLPNELGLGEVLINPSFLHSALQDTKIPGVRLLSSGSLPRVAAELLGSSKMKAVIQRLGQEADMVLLDGPPVLASADAVVLAPLVDGILLVVAQDQSTVRQVELALRPLSRVGAAVLGMVFNKAKGVGRDYHYYYYQNRDDGQEPGKSVMRAIR